MEKQKEKQKVTKLKELFEDLPNWRKATLIEKYVTTFDQKSKGRFYRLIRGDMQLLESELDFFSKIFKVNHSDLISHTVELIES